jgi:hypothetical protein
LASSLKVSFLPKPIVSRTNHCLVQTPNNKKILAIGGFCSETGNTTLDSIEIFDLSKSEWSIAQAHLPVPLRDFNAISLPEGVLVLGGIDYRGIYSQECFRIVGNKSVHRIASLPILLK